MKLDDKLREVIYGWVTADMDVTEEEHIDKMVAQIKQAFADEGYIDSKNLEHLFSVARATGLMTGQEFYDRFRSEVAKELNEHAMPTGFVMRAAKKASGLQ